MHLFIQAHCSRLKPELDLAEMNKLGSLRGKSKTNLRRARQRVEMRDTPCYDAPATAYACSMHTGAPPEASSGLLSHGRVPRLAP